MSAKLMPAVETSRARWPSPERGRGADDVEDLGAGRAGDLHSTHLGEAMTLPASVVHLPATAIEEGRDLSSMSGILADTAYRLLPA